MSDKPHRLGPLDGYAPFALKNRLVMAPMTRCQCDSLGRPSEPLGDYYVARARGGVGLIIVESCAVNSSDALAYANGCQMNRQIHVDAWRPIIESIHESGAKVWVQLFHGGRLTVPEICGRTPIAPSAIKPGGERSFWRPEVDGQLVHFQTQTPFRTPQEMHPEDIDRVLEDFSTACQLAVAAGFDGIELHGAHGYLIHEFCSKYSNTRDDAYGFNSEFLFASRLVESCRRQVPGDRVLSYRLSTHMIDNYYLDISRMALEDLIPLLARAGIDVFHSSELQVGASFDRSGLSLGAAIRAHTDKPIIGCGGVQSLDDAVKIMAGHAQYDLLAVGRTLITKDHVPQSATGPKFSYDAHFHQL